MTAPAEIKLFINLLTESSQKQENVTVRLRFRDVRLNDAK